MSANELGCEFGPPRKDETMDMLSVSRTVSNLEREADEEQKQKQDKKQEQIKSKSNTRSSSTIRRSRRNKSRRRLKAGAENIGNGRGVE